MKNTSKSSKADTSSAEKAKSELNSIVKSNEFGSVKLTDNVIISIVKKAICNVNGVTRLAGNSLMDSIASMINSQKMYDRSVSMVINADKTLDIEAKINVAYGENIPEIATKIQNTVRDEVKNLLGIKVGKVNVIIQEIEIVTEKKESAQKTSEVEE